MWVVNTWSDGTFYLWVDAGVPCAPGYLGLVAGCGAGAEFSFKDRDAAERVAHALNHAVLVEGWQ